MQPFSGCNCYYLLNKMSYSEGRAMVRRTLEGMRKMGFNVIRMWAFDDGKDPNVNLQCSPGILNEKGKEHLKDLFKMLDDVNNTIQRDPKEPGMKFMMTLTNYLKDYGGIGQYVSWELHREHDREHESKEDAERKEKFFSERATARDYYDKYVQALIKFCKDTTFSNNNNGTTTTKKLIDLVHSWDICNEPRCNNEKKVVDVKNWIQHAAQIIRAADDEKDSAGVRVRPITVGLEGFFGPSSSADLLSCNPYNGSEVESVDWVTIGLLPEIDFVSIHLWPDRWKTNNPKDAIEWSERWIKSHMKVCRDTLKKPLCLQEYNISVDADANWAARDKEGLIGGKCLATSEDRFKLFEKVRELMKDPEDRENHPHVLIGAMVWMIADDVPHREWDKEGHMIVPVHAVAGRSLWELGKDVADRRKPRPARPIASRL